MDHHDEAFVALPLRLAAEPFAKEGISPSCVSLGISRRRRVVTNINSSESPIEVAALADDDGIRSFAISRVVSRSCLLEHLLSAVNQEVDDDELPSAWKTQELCVLVRESPNSNTMVWYFFPEHQDHALPTSSHQAVKDHFRKQQNHHQPSGIPHNSFVAELIIHSIKHYYRQQILEPSVRGFLSVLEKQFSRSDLYLFELLQNAVDDGASIVQFEACGNALKVAHNGRRFSPLDVLGLSSVGLSTKSREGQQRTIGFMGVGFKAVYKRYAKVVINDGNYRFAYEEPANNQQGYGWVMLPQWQSKLTQSDTDHQNWCKFSLEKPRGGSNKIDRDLSVLPRTAPPLLGRAALIKNTDEQQLAGLSSWVLNWNHKRHTIKRSNVIHYDASNASENLGVEISTPSNNTEQQQTWLFVTHKYIPTEEASSTYQSHTKRKHTGKEEVCGFFRLSQDNLPFFATTKHSTNNGIVHSVLPTKIKLPIPMHVQGSWLLSVDRQQVQDLTDNTWNREILQRLPELVATAFRWAASQKLDSVEHYGALTKLLPINISNSNGGSDDRNNKHTYRNSNSGKPRKALTTEILGQSISLEALQKAFWNDRILPVGLPPPSQEIKADCSIPMDSHENNSLSIVTGYYEGQHTVWVPPAWFRFLPVDFLRGWLGKRPLRTDLLGGGAYHLLLGSDSVVCQLENLPDHRSNHLRKELMDDSGTSRHTTPSFSVWKVVRLMAAIGASYKEHPAFDQENSILQNGEANNPRFKNSAKKARDEENSSALLEKEMMPLMPKSVNDWPIFLTTDGCIEKLEKIILPSEDISRLPTELFSLLRPHLGDHLEPQIPQQRNQRNEKRGHWRKSSSGQSLRKPAASRLHESLESAIACIDCSATDDTFAIPDHFEKDQESWREIAKQASFFLGRARQEMPSRVVNVATAVANYLKSFPKGKLLNEQERTSVLQIGKHALESSDHRLFAHILVDVPGDCGVNAMLVPASQAYIGRGVNETGTGGHLERFAGPNLRYVSSQYNSILDTKPSIGKSKLLQLFSQAGVQTGISVSISVVDVGKDKKTTSEIVSKLPDGKLPPLRKNVPKSEILLPYGLGVVMNRKKHYLIDSEIPREWERLVTTMSAASSIGFISLLLSIPFENSKNITGTTVVAAAKCFAGKGGSTEENRVPVDSIRISPEMNTPLRRRLYFLPPGQPGAKALDISGSRLLNQLQSIKWLPCSMPSNAEESLTLLSPSEALLESDSSRTDMPVVNLPAALIAKLKESTIAKALTWGIHAPPPPVGELTQLVAKVKLLFSSTNDRIDNDEISMIASKMFSIWNAICRSYLRGELSPTDKQKLKLLSASYCIPVKRVLDSGASTTWIVQRGRCVRMPVSLPTFKNDNEAIKSLTVASLVASNFMCDFNHPNHNPFFHKPEISKALIELSGIQDLGDFQSHSLISTCGSFIRYCCIAEPVISSRSSPLRDSFSYALKWCLKSPKELPKGKDSLKVWVRHGPGIGTKALPARWLPLHNGSMRAVLDDNKLKSALLTPEMNLQLLGVLDHSHKEQESTNARLLSSIDESIISNLGILRLSDKSFTVKTRARGSPVIIDGASEKLQLIFALIRDISLDRQHILNTDAIRENTFLAATYKPFAVIRHDSLTREFQAPGMTTPSSIHLYAMIGKSPKLTKNKCILVCGESEDYSMELEEIVRDHVGIRSTTSLVHLKPYRAAVRLLSHMENESSFIKFVERDFADYEATSSWKRMMKRKEVLRKLAVAEKSKNIFELRASLIKAEEICDDDPDGGDDVLRNARNLLSTLEKEAKEKIKRQEEQKDINKSADDQLEAKMAGRGRGISNLPAWMTSSGAVGETHSSVKSNSSDENKTETNQFDNADESTENSKDHQGMDTFSRGLGRGRGVSNLPAWMTSKELKDAGPTTLDNSTSIDPLHNETGRGRGVSNLPAWMTSKEPKDAGPPESPSTKIKGSIDKESSIDDTKESGMGRGRGISNLPAWMTSNETAIIGSTGSACGDSIRNPISPNSEKAPLHSSAEEEAKHVVSTILADCDADSHFITGRGRGRGISNLPAWMAKMDSCENPEGTSTKRQRSESPTSEAPMKNARLTETSATSIVSNHKLTIDFKLPANEETEFCKWLQKVASEELKNRGGSIVAISDE